MALSKICIYPKYYRINFVTRLIKPCYLNCGCRKYSTQLPQGTSKIGLFGWFLLIIPVSTLGLGTWQVQRKAWKENLIRQLNTVTTSEPVPLPDNLDDLQNMEYRPVHVRGHFLNEKELHMGPRTLIVHGDAVTKSQLISPMTNKSQGYLVITPFKLADRDDTILINRGWVPQKCKDQSRREKGQVEGNVDVIGVVRLHENRPNFVPKNQVNSNQWFYKDLHQMAQVTGASPVLLDATNEFDVPEGPIGGQTQVSLRNEHLSYIFTWYSLSAATSYLWYKQFIKR